MNLLDKDLNDYKKNPTDPNKAGWRECDIQDLLEMIVFLIFGLVTGALVAKTF